VIDDDLMAAALEARPNATKRSVVEEGLRLIVRLHRRRRVRSLRGKLRWVGNVESMRRDHGSAWYLGLDRLFQRPFQLAN
jgi:Arc/MetJ family transcription regulator